MADSVRHPDWPTRLAQFVAAARTQPFAWGAHDCATFAADWIELCTGKRVFDPPYTDAMTAARYIEERGGMLAAVAAALGEPMPNPMAASRGDVALAVIDERECLSVVLGEHVAGPSADGLVMVSRALMRAAWRV